MWSLGLISYMLLTGKHPFFDPDTTKMFCRVAAGDYQFKPEDWRNTSTDAKVGWPAAAASGTCFCVSHEHVLPFSLAFVSCCCCRAP